MFKKINHLLNTNLSTRKSELESYFNVLLHKSAQPKNKFFIFAHYRTGSTLLKSLIDSHPEIKCDGEIFLPFVYLDFKKMLFPNLYIKNNLYKCKMDNYGFILRLSQLQNVLTRFHKNPKYFIKNLYKNDWKIIHLKRRNYLRQAISNILHLERGQAHDTPEKPLKKTIIRISPEKLMKSIKWMENCSKREDQILKDINHIKIFYEDDLLNSDTHQSTSDRIFRYLGLPSEIVKTKLRRTSSDKIGEYVENFDELVEFLNQTEYSKFLEKN